ncbi:MAG: TRAP transporter small permease [Betaproteobacteria bacterium]
MSNAKLSYQRAMEKLYIACVVLSGLALVVITLIIPLGVFMRYAMNKPIGWPEPAAVIMMVSFSFIGGAAVYRANVHIAVQALLKAVKPWLRNVMEWGVTACMASTAAFMLYEGARLCWIVKDSSMAEFPAVSQGLVYLPIPLAGFLTLLFIVEKVWVGEPPQTSIMYRDLPTEAE